MYDVVIIGAGLYGAVFARICKDAGKSVLVIDERDHVGGNVYDEKRGKITVQKYGAHIFHTSNEDVWNFLNKYTSFKPFKNEVKAVYKGKKYSLPFNMNTFYEIYNCKDIEKAKQIINEKTNKYKNIIPKNLEEQALKLVGEDIYNILIKGYTEKQWMKDCKDLPPEIIKRLPLRFEFNNNYFNDVYQGIPSNGYTYLINKLLEGIDVKLNTKTTELTGKFNVYCGKIDEFFNYCYGKLEYRSLRFKNEFILKEYIQDRAVVNYTDKNVPYTRIIEHKYFLDEKTNSTIITYEYPIKYNKNQIPFYSINNDKNNKLYEKYKEKASQIKNLLISGRLGKYKYFDMDDVVELAMKEAKEYLENENKKI